MDRRVFFVYGRILIVSLLVVVSGVLFVCWRLSQGLVRAEGALLASPTEEQSSRFVFEPDGRILLGPARTPSPEECLQSFDVVEVLPEAVARRLGSTLVPATMTEGFEGAWPSSGWTLSDQSTADGGEYLLGKRSCRPHSGSYAGWMVGGGATGATLPCNGNYPDNAKTWAVYGPFSLVGATSARLTFYLYGQSEAGGSDCPYDHLFVGSSVDGREFLGAVWCGDYRGGPAGSGYSHLSFDLSNRLGQSRVWIAFVFKSDSSYTYGGFHIDDVRLEVSDGATATPTRMSPTPTPGSETILMTEGFEGAWPSSGWTLFDQSTADGGEYLLGKRSCRPHSGSYAGWMVGGGATGATLPCNGNYPDNAKTWAVYGPFSLVGATSARLTFYLYGQSEEDENCSTDFFFAGSSIDGRDFRVRVACGDLRGGPAGNGYYYVSFDLSDRLGQGQVWIAFGFVSNSAQTFNGFHIDDVTLLATYGGTPPTPTPTEFPPYPVVTPTRTPTATRTRPPSSGKVWLPVILRPGQPEPTLTPTPWCDPYEPNDDRRTNPWGPLVLGQVYWAKLCAGDPRDNYYFEVTSSDPLQINLRLPGSLVHHTALWLYGPGNLEQPICGGGPIGSVEQSWPCPSAGPGRYVISLYTDGVADDVNPYSLQVLAAAAPTATPTRTWTPTPTRAATPTPTLTPPTGWVVIKEENFEGSFPNEWQLGGASGYTWGKRNCRAAGGSFSGWAVGGGSSGQVLACGSNYPNDVATVMVYGPFSLADARAADVLFDLWLKSERGYDGLCVGASVDGQNFSWACLTGDSEGWGRWRFDLSDVPDLGNLMGRPQVWIAFGFASDQDTTYPEGAYVDNIVLRKSATGSIAPGSDTGERFPGPGGVRAFGALREGRLEGFRLLR